MFKKLFQFLLEDAGPTSGAKQKQRKVKVQPRREAPATKAKPQKPTQNPKPKSEAGQSASSPDDQQTIQQAIAEASRLVEMEEAASGETESRRELIHAAMNIYRAKQTAFDDLDPQERARLRLLSETMAEAKKPKTH